MASPDLIALISTANELMVSSVQHGRKGRREASSGCNASTYKASYNDDISSMMSQETIVNRTRGKKGWNRGKLSSPANSIVVGKKMRDEPKLFLLLLDLCSDLLHPELIVVLSEVEMSFGCDPVRNMARLSESGQKAFM